MRNVHTHTRAATTIGFASAQARPVAQVLNQKAFAPKQTGSIEKNEGAAALAAR